MKTKTIQKPTLCRAIIVTASVREYDGLRIADEYAGTITQVCEDKDGCARVNAVTFGRASIYFHEAIPYCEEHPANSPSVPTWRYPEHTRETVEVLA